MNIIKFNFLISNDHLIFSKLSIRIHSRLIILPCIPGRCGHGSPCEQLCYELHDGMYECDCKDGYILHKNGYSCAGEFTSSAYNSPFFDSSKPPEIASK